jgi:hypothetical protein
LLYPEFLYFLSLVDIAIVTRGAACAMVAPCYLEGMITVQQKLESLFAKLRTFPEARQQAAVEALAEITREPYRLSDEGLAVLRQALGRAQHGKLADHALASDFLAQPWR